MARQWRHCWVQRCLVLFISFQLLATLPPSFWDRNNNIPNFYAYGAPTTTSQQRNTNISQRHSLHQPNLHTSSNSIRNAKDAVGEGTAPYRRREIVQDVMDDDDDGDSNNNGDSSSDTFDDGGTNSNSNNSPQTNSRAAAATVHPLKIASVLCNSDVPQLLGPGWNGTFSTNSDDGAYPSLSRTCTFTMQAMPSSTGAGSGGNGDNSRPTPYVVALTFSTPIQLVCGTDYLTLYDGPDVSAPILAKICGNIWSDKIPTFYSTGPVLTAVFSSQESSPGSFGFTAVWYSIAPCTVCTASGRGTCSSSNTCNCSNRYTGAVCETETAGSKDFTPRSQHAMAYDPKKDMVYIMGGTSLRNPFMGDLLTYTFSSNRWNKITAARSPDPRYGHFAFMYNDELYIYGGHSIIGALADIWRFDGKTWLQQLASNPERLPAGRAGSANVVVTSNNATKLYVFGGLTSSGTTSRELNIYDLATNRWTKMDHQNSVGLSGATAVYHQATDSIYYFGGMVNLTSRNVITYQYRIYQELWYALAPRIDPLTATPVSYWNVTNAPALNMTALETDDDGDSGPGQNSTVQYLPAVMYDPLTTIWTPAGVIGEDTVVMYGGMRPYGPGVNEREQSCFASSFAVYDLSCQNWTSYDVSELDGILKGRVNHTMVIRPPGAPGGSKTAYTAYIFGGFDGTDRADMLNATMTIPASTPGAINNCRALRWCNLYDDCQYCPANYCSYINGLCLFDTEKAKNAQILAGNSNDVPRSGTIQDLVRQRPQLKGQIQNPDVCPSRIALELTNPYSGTIQSGQEISFRIYVDAADLNIQYEIRTLPTSALEFKTLNVWEGFVNMFWRADHALTDDSWTSAASDPSALDLPVLSSNASDSPVISPGGLLNTSELMNRWTKYSGLNADPSTSAIRDDTSYVYFLASDPRRFAGYHVFSLTNHNPTALSYSVTVTLLNHPTSVDRPPGARFNMATLGFFMLGFILAVVLLVVTARKIRQLIEDRDASHRTAEMQLLVDEDDNIRRNNRGGLNGGMAMIQMDGTLLLKKPLYRIVVEVQDMGKEAFRTSGSNLRHRHVRSDRPGDLKDQGSPDPKSKEASTTPALPQSLSHPTIVQPIVEVQDSPSPRRENRSRVRSDFIRDIGSAPLPLTAAEESMMQKESSALARSSSFVDSHKLSASAPDLAKGIDTDSNDKNGSKAGVIQSSLWTKSTPSLIRQVSRNEHQMNPPDQNATPQRPSNLGETGLQRGWSLRSLGRNSSLTRSFSHRSMTTAEEREGLTNQTCIEEEVIAGGVSVRGSFDSEQEIVDLGGLLSPTDLLQQRQEQIERHCREEEEAAAVSGLAGRRQRRRRNPIKVQPISIEPLPFHSGLVPRTMAHLKKYRRNLARQHRRQNYRQDQQQQQQQQQGQRQGQTQGLLPPSMSRQQSNESIGSRGHSPVPPASGPSPLDRQHQVRAVKSHGSLREVCRAASRMASRSQGDIFPKNMDVNADETVVSGSKSFVEKRPLPQVGWNGNEQREDLEAAIELKQLDVSSHRGGGGAGSSGSGVGIGSQGHDTVESMTEDNCNDGLGGGSLGSPFSSPVQERSNHRYAPQPDLPRKGKQDTRDGGSGGQKQKKPIKMRGRQEYEPGPLLAMNFLIVFPGDSGSRRVSQQGEGSGSRTSNEAEGVVDEESEGVEEKDENGDTLYNSEKRLPPMAIGTVFVPDPVRWWAYKAKQQLDRQKFERELRRMHNKHSKSKDKENLHQYQQQVVKPSSLSKGRRAL